MENSWRPGSNGKHSVAIRIPNPDLVWPIQHIIAEHGAFFQNISLWVNDSIYALKYNDILIKLGRENV